jgi:hypothetical protein
MIHQWDNSLLRRLLGPIQPLVFCAFFLLITLEQTKAQSCPGSVTFNNSTLPGLILPLTDSAFSYTISTNSGTQIVNVSSGTTVLTLQYKDDPIGTPEIVINPTVVLSYTGSGSFTSAIASCGVIEVSTTGISQNGFFTPLSSPNSFLVYPTVSTGTVTVTGSSNNIGNADMLVVDESGRTVYHLHNNGSTTVNLYLNNVASGIYFLRVNNGNGFVKAQKIIISK